MATIVINVKSFNSGSQLTSRKGLETFISLLFVIIVFVFEGHEEYEEEFDCVKIFESSGDPSAIEDCSWYRSARLGQRAT